MTIARRACSRASVYLLSQTERHDEARAVMSRLREIDPLYAMNHAMSAQVAFQARD
jgi:hypothetical protein